MAKARSPGYPSIGLGDAVEKITAVWKNDYQNKIPRHVVARHAGYNSMNGRALSVLASLSKYGLLDGRGDENWVSDLALEIIVHPQKSPERAKAMSEAADLPSLFHEISERFPGGVSDVALKSYLLKSKFLPDAADTAVRCYRETKQLVLDETGENATLGQTNDGQENMRAQVQQPTEIPVNLMRSAAHAAGNAHVQAVGRTLEPLTVNRPKLSLEGKFMRIEALVDTKGIERLLKIIAANAPLLEEDDEAEPTSPSASQQPS